MKATTTAVTPETTEESVLITTLKTFPTPEKIVSEAFFRLVCQSIEEIFSRI